MRRGVRVTVRLCFIYFFMSVTRFLGINLPWSIPNAKVLL